MLHIIKQYKRLLNNIFFMGFNSHEDAVKVINEKASNKELGSFMEENKQAIIDFVKNIDENSDSSINTKDMIKYVTDSDTQIALNEILSQLNIDQMKIIEGGISMNQLISRINSFVVEREGAINSSRNEINGLSNEVQKNYKFERKLEKGVEGEDVKILQEFLIEKGYLNSTYKNRKGEELSNADGIFGSGTTKALKKYQAEVLGFKNTDGVMDLDGKTMTYITKEINANRGRLLNDLERNTKYGRETVDVIDNLVDVEKYLTAFNKVYGGKEDFISRHNGLLGVVAHLGEDDLDRLYEELQPDFSRLEDDKQDEFAKEIGLEKNSDKYNDGLKRIAIIAVIGAIMSGGSTLALELFAINYGENLKEGPEVDKILKALRKEDTDTKKEFKEMYKSPDTTVVGLNRVLDILNNPNMDTANLKRLVADIYNPNWFHKTFGIFTPKDLDKVEDLIEKFEKTENVKYAKEIVAKVYTYSYEAFLEAREDLSKSTKTYLELDKKYRDNPPQSHVLLSADEDLKNAYNVIKRHNDVIKDFHNASKGFSKLSIIISRYTNLDAKRAKIEGDQFDINYAREREKQIDTKLGIKDLKNVSERLHSRDSFGYRVEVSKLSDAEYMDSLISKMKQETINYETSVLAGVIRGVEQHYFAGTETFSPEEFINAFKQTAAPAESDYVLSNLGREKLQNFQGDIEGNLFKINLNGREIYFKDACTNIVTVVNDVFTTVDSANSVPIVIPFNTGISGYGDKGGNSNIPGANSMPGDTDPVTTTGTGGPGI